MICKWNEQNNITFEVRGVRKSTVQDDIVTKFYITDFIKGIKNSSKKYWCTVFDDIDLEDGDRIKIMDLDRIVTSMNPKTKLISQFISVIPEIIKKGTLLGKDGKVNNPYEE